MEIRTTYVRNIVFLLCFQGPLRYEDQETIVHRMGARELETVQKLFEGVASRGSCSEDGKYTYRQ